MRLSAASSLALTLAAAAHAQTWQTEITPAQLASGPITTIAPGAGARATWAAPTDGATVWKKEAGAWTQLAIPVAGRPKTSPFAPVGGMLLADVGPTGLLFSPRGNGIWRSPDGVAPFAFCAGVPQYQGWDFNTDYRFSTTGVVAANNALYAATGQDEGNSSNGHSSMWTLIGSAGVLRSTDGGQSWSQFSTGLPTFGFDNTFGTTREPIKVIAAHGNTLLLETAFEKLYRSVNNGAWQLVANRGGLPTYMTEMRSVPLVGWLSTTRGLIAVVRNQGLYLSTDNGLNYTLTQSQGLPAQADIHTFIQTPDGLFVVLGEAATEENPAPPIRFLKSTDQGLTFRRHAAPLPGSVMTMAYRDGRLMVSSSALGVVSVSTTTCLADLGAAGGVPDPDGSLDNNDFIAFINAFFAEKPEADVGTDGGITGTDGRFDNNDFIAFIGAFFTGCP